jgi:hypothetical protein
VVASEAGGITQGIGAYKVQVPVDGQLQTCVFLDTPGHEVHTTESFIYKYNIHLSFFWHLIFLR